jgi:hypothetical protein
VSVLRRDPVDPREEHESEQQRELDGETPRGT